MNGLPDGRRDTSLTPGAEAAETFLDGVLLSEGAAADEAIDAMRNWGGPPNGTVEVDAVRAVFECETA